MPQQAASTQRQQAARSPCVYESMKPTSESPGVQAARYLSVAEGNCRSARACGEQSEANDQPQSPRGLNLIRPGKLTSRRTGGICASAGVPDEVLGASHDASHHPRLAWYRVECRVFGVGMARRLHGLSKDPCPGRESQGRSQSPHSSDEAANHRGAKGDRKGNAR